MTAEFDPSRFGFKNLNSVISSGQSAEPQRMHYDNFPNGFQIELLQMLAEGLTSKGMALRLGRSVHSINKHLVKIHKQLKESDNVDLPANSIGAMVFAYRQGLLRTEVFKESAGRMKFLSVREMEVLGQMEMGLKDSEIAKSLLITPFTVNKHVSSILLKLEVECRSSAVIRGLIYKDTNNGSKVKYY